MTDADKTTNRRFAAQAVNVVVEHETGAAITVGALAPRSPCRITVLRDTTTGAEIRLDDAMLQYFAATVDGFRLEQEF